MAHVYKVKISRRDAGAYGLFSLIYIVADSDFATLQRALPAMTGFLVRHHIEVPWHTVMIGETSSRVAGARTEIRSTTLGALIPDLYRTDDPWHIVVPVLPINSPYQKHELTRPQGVPQKLYLKGQINPHVEDPRPVLGYLTSSLRRKNKTPAAYPPTTYFATRDMFYPSMCMACPNYAHHLAGQCSIGDTACFVHFRDFEAPNMYSNIRDYLEKSATTSDSALEAPDE